MTKPTFYLTTYLTRGLMEREIMVDVEYTCDADDFEVVAAKDMTDGAELTDEEMSQVEDDVAGECGFAWAEYQAERGEYLRDLREDARTAGSYVPPVAAL